LLQILRDHSIQHLPLIDEDQKVVALVTLDDFVADQESPVQAVIMAGGLGLRMRPLTEETPKPMLPVGGRPLLEIIVDQLRSTGIKHISIAVNHKLEKIVEHFGDGKDFGVDITYATEDRPLGTAGALGLIKQPDDTTLVINGDILTSVDFGAMLAFHREHQAELTIAVTRHESQIPYGVVECDGAVVRGISEKPLMSFLINAGIYLLEPASHGLIPNGEPYDMTDLIVRLLEENRTVVAFPIREYWIDVGQMADYEQAQADFPEVSTTQ
jgi:NDP-sugar pyrophosphorylase family protein